MDRMILRLRTMFGWTEAKLVDGRFIPELDRAGFEKCPYCGDSRSFSRKGMSIAYCNTCANTFYTYGILGWELVKNEDKQKVA